MTASPEESVFLNCPFDERYTPLFDALLFATVCCGFVPRSALESGAVAEPRIDRVVRTLFASRYSIHDLSRSRGEGAEGWARLNMPLELGIAMARRYITRHRRERHDWLLLVAEGHSFRRFISDLSGFDPEKAPVFLPCIPPSAALGAGAAPPVGAVEVEEEAAGRRLLRHLPAHRQHRRGPGDQKRPCQIEPLVAPASLPVPCHRPLESRAPRSAA